VPNTWLELVFASPLEAEWPFSILAPAIFHLVNALSSISNTTLIPSEVTLLQELMLTADLRAGSFQAQKWGCCAIEILSYARQCNLYAALFTGN
jgi:hypothetical protein